MNFDPSNFGDLGDVDIDPDPDRAPAMVNPDLLEKIAGEMAAHFFVQSVIVPSPVDDIIDQFNRHLRGLIKKNFSEVVDGDRIFQISVRKSLTVMENMKDDLDRAFEGDASAHFHGLREKAGEDEAKAFRNKVETAVNLLRRKKEG